jgi:cobyrinic acid a,c-diamide synthase
VKKLTPVISSVAKEAVRLYVASDEAFCFWYEDNHDLLKALGAEIRFFSPVRDKGLPPDADGLVLWGGYPDLYAGELENNADMRRSLKTAIEAGLPVYAESGGFVYLMQSLTDSGGNEYDMLGALPGQARMSDKLQSFGYHELSARRDTLLCEAGDRINAHFFNYFECVNEGNRGDSFIAEKNGNTFPCIVSKGNIFAGFQHLHFLVNPRFAGNFIGACQKYRGRGDEA